MERCRYCGSEKIHKAGFKHGKQKWLCRECGVKHGEVDSREKYTQEERDKAISLHSEGFGFRCIERLLSEIYKKQFRHQTVILWVKKANKKAPASDKERKI